MGEKQLDVKASIEWAWVNQGPCIVRNENNIAVSIDFGRSLSPAPPGGESMLDFAFSNKVAFTNLAVKVLGGEISDEDEVMVKEKKSLKELRKLLVRFEKAGKVKKIA